MQSNCPNCQEKIEHEEHLFEVECKKCRTRFNPFLEFSEGRLSDFSESEKALSEIRDFGETLQEKEVSQVSHSTTSPKTPVPPQLDAFESKDGFVFTPNAPTENGIEFFTPISVLKVVDSQSSDHVQKGWEELKMKAQQLGCNGLVLSSCQVAPDLSKVLLMGIPFKQRSDS